MDHIADERKAEHFIFVPFNHIFQNIFENRRKENTFVHQLDHLFMSDDIDFYFAEFIGKIFLEFLDAHVFPFAVAVDADGLNRVVADRNVIERAVPFIGICPMFKTDGFHTTADFFIFTAEFDKVVPMEDGKMIFDLDAESAELISVGFQPSLDFHHRVFPVGGFAPPVGV